WTLWQRSSERVALRVSAIDVDPTRARESVRAARDPRQVVVAGQAQVESGTDRLTPDKAQRKCILRLTRTRRLPTEDPVHRPVGEERAGDRWAARTHHARGALPPSLADGAPDARDVHSGAAFEAGDLGMHSKQPFRLHIGGLGVLEALDRAAETRD